MTNQDKMLGSIGVISSYRGQKNSKTLRIAQGTGFAVSPHLVMTSTRNVYDQHQHKIADRIEYQPFFFDQKPDEKEYTCDIQNLLKNVGFLKTQHSRNLNEFQDQNIICVFYVPERIESQYFPTVGGRLKAEDQVTMFGLKTKNNIQSQKHRPLQISHQFQDFTILTSKDGSITYTTKKPTDFCGSPILSTRSRGLSAVLGMHTFSRYENGVNKGYGVNFDDEIIKDLKEIQQNLYKSNNNYNQFQRIDFYNNFKEEKRQYTNGNIKNYNFSKERAIILKRRHEYLQQSVRPFLEEERSRSKSSIPFSFQKVSKYQEFYQSFLNNDHYDFTYLNNFGYQRLDSLSSKKLPKLVQKYLKNQYQKTFQGR